MKQKIQHDGQICDNTQFKTTQSLVTILKVCD